jgi:hypothetical protein
VHGDDYSTDYLIDLVKNRSIAFLIKSLRKRDDDAEDASPVFMVLSMPAAHEPADPAPQYANYAEGVIAPRTPNFNMV